MNKLFFSIAFFFLLKITLVSSQENLKIDKTNYQAVMDQSQKLYKEYRYTQSIQLLEQLYQFDTTNIEVTNKLGELYSGYNKNKAIFFLSKTLELDTMNLYALIASGDIYLKNGEPLKAQSFYFYVINYVDSSNYFAYKQIANGYYSMGIELYQFALENYQKAVKLNPFDITSYSRIGNIYNVFNKFSLADSVSNIALKIDSLNSSILNIKAYALYNLKQYVPAIHTFDIVFQKGDTIQFSLKYTGLSYFNMNDFKKAQIYLERAIVYDSTDYDLYIILGQICLQKNDYKKGLYYLKKGETAHYPPPQKWSMIFKTMADIYNQQKEWDKAIECFQQAYKLNPDDKTLMCKLAYQYDYLDQKEKAIVLYTKVIETADASVYVDEVKLAKARLQKLKEAKKK